MALVVVSNVVNRDFNFLSNKTKDYDIGICYFYSKHEVLKSKD